VKATLTVTDEAGTPLPRVRITGHFFDDYWLDHTVAGRNEHQRPDYVQALGARLRGSDRLPRHQRDHQAGPDLRPDDGNLDELRDPTAPPLNHRAGDSLLETPNGITLRGVVNRSDDSRIAEPNP
jgi:hypothetical protein